VVEDVDLTAPDGPAAADVRQGPGLPGRLEAFVGQVVPLLRTRGLFRHEYTWTALRFSLGLAGSVNRNDLGA
jgi:hypothetical protein